jgi:hypothetical protein
MDGVGFSRSACMQFALVFQCGDEKIKYNALGAKSTTKL